LAMRKMQFTRAGHREIFAIDALKQAHNTII
jgi:hypothetical protein